MDLNGKSVFFSNYSAGPSFSYTKPGHLRGTSNKDRKKMSAGIGIDKEFADRLRYMVFRGQPTEVRALLDELSGKPEEFRRDVLENRDEKNNGKTILLTTISGETAAYESFETRQVSVFVRYPFPGEPGKVYAEIADMLIKAGADPLACDDNGCDLFTHPRSKTPSAENLLPLARLPREKLPPMIKVMDLFYDMANSGKRNIEFSLDVHDCNHEAFLKAKKELEAEKAEDERKKKEAEEEAKIRAAIVEDRLKRGCCEACGHQPESRKKQKK